MRVTTLAEKVALIMPNDYKVLKILYELRTRYERVPLDVIKASSKMSENELKDSILKLTKLRLIYKYTNGIVGYRLNFSGLDVLATKTLASSNIIKSLGIIIGEGKESNVYFAKTSEDLTVVVKYHRIGRSSFKNAKRLRNFKGKDWISISVENARREYEALKCISENGGNVPKVYGYAYNAVVMDYIEGREITELNLENPEDALNDIFATLRIAYKYCDCIIHGDLSPYNVLYDINENKIFIIDWSQAQKNNIDMLVRDIQNILKYFKKKYNINRDLNEIINYITS
ncbi:MAG: RIO1 family regulatory kinase/ATPase [Sulfolobaceae archaeon]